MIVLPEKSRAAISYFLDEKIDQKLKLEILEVFDSERSRPVIAYADMLEILKARLNDHSCNRDVLLFGFIIGSIFDWAYTDDPHKWQTINKNLLGINPIPTKYRKKPEGKLEKRTLIL